MFVTDAFWQHSQIDYEIRIPMIAIIYALRSLGSKQVKFRFQSTYYDSPSVTSTATSVMFATDAFWQPSRIDHEISILMIYTYIEFSEQVKLRFERSPDSPSIDYFILLQESRGSTLAEIPYASLEIS